ncbi:MAG: ABC transporter substrate-binding protein [Candidatus Thorarchaeota archaeon]
MRTRTIIVAVSLITILSTSALSTYTAPRQPFVPPFIVPETDNLVYCSEMEFLGMDWGGTLDPARACRATSMRIVSNCYDTLVTYDRGRMDRFRPLLVTEVPSLENGRISPDGLTYRFTIRSDSPLTPEDVEYSFKRAMIREESGILQEVILGSRVVERWWPWNGTPYYDVIGDFEDIDNAVEAEGNDVVFHLTKIYPPFMHVLASSCSSILSKAWCVEAGDWPGTEETWESYIGDTSPLDAATQGFGPFIFERWYNTGWPDGYEGIVLVRNEDYWRRPARLEEVEFKIFDHSGAFTPANCWEKRKQMLLDGNADICLAARNPVEEERLWYRQAELEGVEGIRVYMGLPTLEYHPLDFNFAIANISPCIGSGKLDGNGIPPDFFSDIDIRKAFAYCLDYDTIINESYAGEAQQPASPVLEGLPFHNPNQECYTYDLDMARQHFQQAWGGEVWNKGFNLTLVYAEAEDRPMGPGWYGVEPLTPRTTEILKDSIEAINTKFHVTLLKIPSAGTYGWYEEIGDWDENLWTLTAFICPVDSYLPDPNSFVTPFLHCTGDFGFWVSREIPTYTDSTVNSLIEAGLNTVDSAERQAIYYELQRIYHEDVLGIPLVQPLTRHYQRDWVWGWYHNPAADMDFYEMLKGTYQDATRNIIAHIEDLVDSGILGPDAVSSLNETLDSAITLMDIGDVTTASQKLNDFIDQVNALDLPVENREELIALAQEIIEVLISTLSSSLMNQAISFADLGLVVGLPIATVTTIALSLVWKKKYH